MLFRACVFFFKSTHCHWLEAVWLKADSLCDVFSLSSCVVFICMCLFSFKNVILHFQCLLLCQFPIEVEMIICNIRADCSQGSAFSSWLHWWMQTQLSLTWRRKEAPSSVPLWSGKVMLQASEAEHPLLQWKTSRFNFGYVTVCVAVASLYCCSKCWRRLIWCLCEIYRPQWYPGLCDCVTSAPGICSGSWCSLQKGNCLHFRFHYSLESSWTVFVDTSITFMQIPTALLTIVVT